MVRLWPQIVYLPATFTYKQSGQLSICWPVIIPAVKKSWLMDWVNELAVIPRPLKTPPSMTVLRQPSFSTSTLQRGPMEQVECFYLKHEAEMQQRHALNHEKQVLIFSQVNLLQSTSKGCCFHTTKPYFATYICTSSIFKFNLLIGTVESSCTEQPLPSPRLP